MEFVEPPQFTIYPFPDPNRKHQCMPDFVDPPHRSHGAKWNCPRCGETWLMLNHDGTWSWWPVQMTGELQMPEPLSPQGPLPDPEAVPMHLRYYCPQCGHHVFFNPRLGVWGHVGAEYLFNHRALVPIDIGPKQ